MDRIKSEVVKTLKKHQLTLTEDEFKEAITEFVYNKLGVKLPKNCFMFYARSGGGCDNRHENDEVSISWTTEE